MSLEILSWPGVLPSPSPCPTPGLLIEGRQEDAGKGRESVCLLHACREAKKLPEEQNLGPELHPYDNIGRPMPFAQHQAQPRSQ